MSICLTFPCISLFSPQLLVLCAGEWETAPVSAAHTGFRTTVSVLYITPSISANTITSMLFRCVYMILYLHNRLINVIYFQTIIYLKEVTWYKQWHVSVHVQMWTYIFVCCLFISTSSFFILTKGVFVSDCFVYVCSSIAVNCLL